MSSPCEACDGHGGFEKEQWQEMDPETGDGYWERYSVGCGACNSMGFILDPFYAAVMEAAAREQEQETK